MIKVIGLAELAKRSGGQLKNEAQGLSFDRVSTDSRDCEGALFVALIGESHNGHDYVKQACEQGALAVVVQQGQEFELAENAAVPVLEVADTRTALACVGALNREAFKGKLVALTGSSGKTTTKNMLSAILRLAGKTTATKANHNNEIGVPQTLMAIEADSAFAVVEVGARHIGDIAYLGDFVQPDVAVVVNAGSAHLGEFGSYENIVEAKGEIYQGLREKSVAVLNADDQACEHWQQAIVAQGRAGQVLRFSAEGAANDVVNLGISELTLGAHDSTFTLHYGAEQAQVRLNAAGRHNVQSALAAAACALACGVSLALVAQGLSSLCAQDSRMQLSTLPSGIVLMDDSYNANPVSMRAAIDVLGLQAGQHYAALGTMGELGEQALNEHKALATYAKRAGLVGLFVMGEFAEDMAQAFGAGAQVHNSFTDMATEIRQQLQAGDHLLIKGSRSAAMDQLVSALTGDLN